MSKKELFAFFCLSCILLAPRIGYVETTYTSELGNDIVIERTYDEHGNSKTKYTYDIGGGTKKTTESDYTIDTKDYFKTDYSNDVYGGDE